MATVQQALNTAQPNDFPAMMNKIRFGDILAGLVPTRVERTGLDNSATHVEPSPGMILFVDVGGTQQAILTGPAAAPGANQVRVTYDADGVATLVFGAANTGYFVVRTAAPSGLAAILAADAGVCY